MMQLFILFLSKTTLPCFRPLLLIDIILLDEVLGQCCVCLWSIGQKMGIKSEMMMVQRELSGAENQKLLRKCSREECVHETLGAFALQPPKIFITQRQSQQIAKNEPNSQWILKNRRKAC